MRDLLTYMLCGILLSCAISVQCQNTSFDDYLEKTLTEYNEFKANAKERLLSYTKNKKKPQTACSTLYKKRSNTNMMKKYGDKTFFLPKKYFITYTMIAETGQFCFKDIYANYWV